MSPRYVLRIPESGTQLKESGTLITIVIRNPRERSIQPKFPEISVQNSMDRFGPTGKVSKKRVYLLRWTTFPGLNRSGFWLNQDRAPSSTDKGSRIQYLESGIHGVESRFQDSLGFLYMGRSVRVQLRSSVRLDANLCQLHFELQYISHLSFRFIPVPSSQQNANSSHILQICYKFLGKAKKVTASRHVITKQESEQSREIVCYSKNPHTRTPIFGFQADWVLIYRVFQVKSA